VVLAALPLVVPAYPPGSLVTLSNGQMALVEGWSPHAPCQPVVRLVEAPLVSRAGRQYQGARGPRGGPQAPRHVHRRHGLNALHHLVYEVVDNSIDEAMAGYATVGDRQHRGGRLVPRLRRRARHPHRPGDARRPGTQRQARDRGRHDQAPRGGKFQQEGSAYKVSGGLHGVGVSCVNALSEYLEAEVHRDGKIHKIRFERGVVVEPSASGGRHPRGTQGNGHHHEFKPDPTIFPDTDFRYETLEGPPARAGVPEPRREDPPDRRARRRARQAQEVTFFAENGLTEYVEHLMKGKTAVSSPVYIKRRDDERA
jgi:DNA gyrase subunit B